MIALEAASLGFSTCWIGGTYNKYALNAYSAFNKKPRVTISRNTKLATNCIKSISSKIF